MHSVTDPHFSVYYLSVVCRHMDGEEAPEDWQGAMDITYRIGPGFANDKW